MAVSKFESTILDDVRETLNQWVYTLQGLLGVVKDSTTPGQQVSQRRSNLFCSLQLTRNRKRN